MVLDIGLVADLLKENFPLGLFIIGVPLLGNIIKTIFISDS
jgi:hypothetical protein